MLKLANESEFNNVINNELVLIDFYADWCGPCRMLAPVLEELNNTRNVKIYKINIDENENLARNLGIMTIPTLLLYKKGSLVAKTIGLKSSIELQNWIDEYK